MLRRLTIGGKKILEFDLDKCHWHLRADFIEDEKCKTKYQDWLNSVPDAYEFFIEGEITEHKRHKMKGAFQQALTGNRDRMNNQAKRIFNYFYVWFPELYEFLKHTGERQDVTMQGLLQRVESSIMVSAHEDATFLSSTRHDSMLVLENDNQKAIDHILTHAIDRLGYKIPFRQEFPHS